MPVDSILEVDSMFSRERMIFGEEAVAKIRQMEAGEVSTGYPQDVHSISTGYGQLVHSLCTYPHVIHMLLAVDNSVTAVDNLVVHS